MRKSSAATAAADPQRPTSKRDANAEAPLRADRRDALLRFFANPPREVAEAARALRDAEAQYGDDADRELADLESGQHPLQQAKGSALRG